MERHWRHPLLTTLYHRYLSDADSASFIQAVARRYTVGTLERLAEFAPQHTRRAATLGLGFLADFQSNAVLGRRLNDRDRAVRVLAEHGIRDIWCRDGTPGHRHALRGVMRRIAAHEYDAAIDEATQLIDEAPWFAELWNQRAITLFHLAAYRQSVSDCRQTLELNPYHFGAAVGMGHCYLELSDGHAALECFRRALKLNPGLEGVRAQIAYLQRALEEL